MEKEDDLSQRLPSRHERRSGTRISPKGTLIFAVGDQRLHARIANIAVDGCLALTTERIPEEWLGGRLAIEVRLDGQMSEWLRLNGHISRAQAEQIAVTFDDVPREFVDLIDAMSSASYSHDRLLSLVLVDATPARRQSMAEAFRTAGCAVIEATTPLEAIVRLGESDFEPDLIAVADSTPSSTSDELRRFVEKAHPRAKLVTIGDELVEPLRLAHWLSAANPNDDLGERIRKVLARPS